MGGSARPMGDEIEEDWIDLRMASDRSEVTAARIGEQRARHAEARLRIALEVGGASPWDCDLDTDQVRLDPGSAALAGLDLHDSSSWSALVQRAHPADRAAMASAMAGVVRAGGLDVDARFDVAGGGVWHLSFRARVVDDVASGRPTVIGLVWDVTAAKATEADLVHQALHDPLTGLANRRAFEIALAREWSRSERDGSALSVLLVDVDDFKRLNDTCGHVAGDRALRVLAGLLRDEVHRAGDLVARFGGEEFVVLLPDTDAAGAEAVGGHLVAACRRSAEVSPFPMTVSVGCATRIGPDTEPWSVVRRADDACYEAKRHGKDRVSAPSMG